MRKNGFTLIELLSVVTIIGLISVLVLPNILKGISDKKSEISEANMKLLESAANMYIENHPSMYSTGIDADGSSYCIALQELVNNNLITTPFKDVDGNEVDYSKLLKATYNYDYNTFTYNGQLYDNSTCIEFINHVNSPILGSGMIPIVFDGNNIKKADVNSKWYSYSGKSWANAVLVKGDKVYQYNNSLAGTVISDEDILGYFVWIPRFRYQLFSSNTRSEINIAFESIGNNKSNGTLTGQWLTHPAFTFNNQELSGIWVGKYNSSNSDGNIVVKSGSPWINIDYNAANEKIISMVDSNNIYGLSGVNTHMVRNSEWSAITYLANSKYGINDDMDSNSSTTGNNTGIYNMVGNKEYVILDAGNVSDLGHALMETDSWTDNTNSFKDSNNLYITRGGSSIFNYDKSTLNNSDTAFRVSLINKDTSTDYKPKYIVTFDPNGGSVDTTSKEVTYGDPYGELPIPTREGYTFKGWNGKNLLYIFDTELVKNGVTCIVENETIKLFGTNTYTAANYGHRGFSKNLPTLDNDKYYTLSITNQLTTGAYVQLNYLRNTGTQNGLIYSLKNGSRTVTINSILDYDKLAQLFIGIVSTATEINEKFNIQLEEGDTATEWEPYYVTSSVPVTQDKNHTLKAIWEANS